MKYEVTFYFHTNCKVTVDADSEEEAIEIAEGKVDEHTDELIGGLQEDDDPDVVEVKS